MTYFLIISLAILAIWCTLLTIAIIGIIKTLSEIINRFNTMDNIIKSQMDADNEALAKLKKMFSSPQMDEMDELIPSLPKKTNGGGFIN